MAEAGCGWLGPFSVDELNAEFGGRWIANRRFGVASTVQVTEELRLEGVDELIAMIKLMFRGLPGRDLGLHGR
eukprot:1999095-Amphidinium_carterae.1